MSEDDSKTVAQVQKNLKSLYESEYERKDGVLLENVKGSALHQSLLSPESIERAARDIEAAEKADSSAETSDNTAAAAAAAVTSETSASASASAPRLPIQKIVINRDVYGERAFVLRNVLTREECQELIALKELVPMVDAHRDHRVRQVMRVEISSIPLAKVLFSRIRPFVAPRVVVDDSNCHDFPQRGLFRGEWNVDGLNDHFRLCCYEPGGHFSVHRDGAFNPTPNCSSIMTVMAYLDDQGKDYGGGTTDFVADHNLHFDEAKGIFAAPEDKIIARVAARAGDMIVFHHAILHQGAPVEKPPGDGGSGLKHIFRTELMYTRSDTLTDAERRGRALLAEAEYHEVETKNHDKAIDCYKKAFKICPELERMV